MRNMPALKIKPRSGFTLLETMIALSIISIVLVAVFEMHSQNISMNNAARFYTTAPLLAQRTMAELEIKPVNEWISDSGNFEDDFSGYNWSIAIDDVKSEMLGSVADDLKKIDVIVSFNNDEFTYDFRTYRFIRNLGI